MAKIQHTRHRARLIKKRGNKVGAPPGTLIHIGDAKRDSQIQLIRYSQQQIQEEELDNTSQCLHQADSPDIAWFNINGLGNPDIVRQIGEHFSLHPLVMEDILNTDHRPKTEVFDDYIYVVIKMLQYNTDTQSVHIEQVSLIIGHNYVLSFQEAAGDVFGGVRNRLRTGRRIRQLGPDYLAYALIDAVVDNYFVLLEQLGDAVELLEDELIGKPAPETQNRIHHFKREMLMLRKAVWPLREVISSLGRDDTPLLQADTRLYLRDIYDHTIHIMDNIEALRDLLANLLDLYMSLISQRMNEVMQTLTVFASVFMPLTFIAGIYGMNFERMPELSWPWGYSLVMTIMLILGGSLLSYFKWKKWF